MRLFFQRHGKGEFRFTVPAGDVDVLAVGKDDGFDDVKPQPDAVAVGGAAFVRFVEAVEDQGKLGRIYGWAGVADGDHGLSALRGGAESIKTRRLTAARGLRFKK